MITCFLFMVGVAHAEEPYTPPPAEKVTSYYAGVMPCSIVREEPFTHVRCKGGELDGKSLRELSILRNTIYARYGWSGYRKQWLKDHFNAQPWFKPNPKFSYKLLSDADRKNAHFIGAKEQSMTSTELSRMRDDLYARRGKVWNDKPEWHLKNGKTVKACKPPKNVVDDEKDSGEGDWEPNDCHYAKQAWYKPNPKFTESDFTAEDKIELGLLSRAMGEFALDTTAREKSEGSLDRILKPEELRQLSLRDLRIVRNTIYARKGRPFKSQILRDHFAGMDWYKIKPDYSDKLLSANDVRNIALIKSVENEFGGPMNDEDWLTEPVVDGA
jgi:hypothetical protein